MDNWEKIINGYAKKAQDQSTLKLIDGVITNINDSKCRRVNVKLLTGQEYENMLNKTEEKLAVGQGVKVGYLTIPSKGWIAFANGEANPLGGDGGGIQVESAAIITTAEDFIITQETMIDYSPATKVLYGNAPAFFICQENYMMLSSTNWTNAEKASCIANEQYFPDAVHFTGYFVNNGIVQRVDDYIYGYISSRTQGTSAKEEKYAREKRRIQYQYPNNDPTETPVFVSDTTINIISNSPISLKDVGNNTVSLTNFTTDMFIVSHATFIGHKNNVNALIQPFFPSGVDRYVNLYVDTAYQNNGWGWAGNNIDYIAGSGSLASSSPVFPFKNRAEQDFSLGVTQRVELAED